MYRIRCNPNVRRINTETSIQGDSGGNVNFFDSDYICYDNKEIYINMCATLSVSCCVMPPLETLLPPGDPIGVVFYLRIVLSPEEASRL